MFCLTEVKWGGERVPNGLLIGSGDAAAARRATVSWEIRTPVEVEIDVSMLTPMCRFVMNVAFVKS